MRGRYLSVGSGYPRTSERRLESSALFCCVYYQYIPFMNDRSNRESNAELLRIICILFILLHHFCVHAFYPEVLQTDMNGQSWDSHLLLFFHAFFFIGVNCFILISGWFSIKPKWRSFFNLYLIYAFYNLLHPFRHVAKALMQGEGFVLPYPVQNIIARTLLPFSHGHLWFMDCYLGLFLMAPLLNAAVNYMNRQQHLLVLILLTVANVYFGDFWSMNLINASEGYSLANFVYLYLIGSYLHRYISLDTINRNRWRWFMAYCIFGVLWGICTILSAYFNNGIGAILVQHWHAFAYNNPIILLTSVSFFLFMMSWHFKSRFINYITASMLGVYMFQEKVIRYGLLVPFAHQFSPIVQLSLLLAVTVAFFIMAVGVDQIRILLTKPVWFIYNRYIEHWLSRLSSKFRSI